MFGLKATITVARMTFSSLLLLPWHRKVGCSAIIVVLRTSIVYWELEGIKFTRPLLGVILAL